MRRRVCAKSRAKSRTPVLFAVRLVFMVAGRRWLGNADRIGAGHRFLQAFFELALHLVVLVARARPLDIRAAAALLGCRVRHVAILCQRTRQPRSACEYLQRYAALPVW